MQLMLYSNELCDWVGLGPPCLRMVRWRGRGRGRGLCSRPLLMRHLVWGSSARRLRRLSRDGSALCGPDRLLLLLLVVMVVVVMLGDSSRGWRLRRPSTH